MGCGSPWFSKLLGCGPVSRMHQAVLHLHFARKLLLVVKEVSAHVAGAVAANWRRSFQSKGADVLQDCAELWGTSSIRLRLCCTEHSVQNQHSLVHISHIDKRVAQMDT